MKIKRHNGRDEAQILLAMITSNPVVARIAALWQGRLFASDWGNAVAELCVNYYRRYHRAPGPAIQQLCSEWAERAGDEATTQLIEKFLGELGDDYRALKKTVNPEYIIDAAALYLNKVAAKRLIEDIEGDLEAGQTQIALDRLQGWKALRVAADSGVDLFTSPDLVAAALADRQESLVRYPGALGTFFGDDLARDCFVALMAPEKTGKTMWLLDIALRGAAQQRKVAFFEVGDMSLNQLLRRVAQRFAKCPLKPKEVKIPTDMDYDDEDGDWKVQYRVKRYTAGLSPDKAQRAMDQPKLAGNFRLSVHAAGTINVEGIASCLETWQREDDWVPDVIVIDYADILAPPAGMREKRDQINETWVQLRSLSQQLHCLLVTATQADANSYNQKIITRSNFSDDKRKLAHVTGLVGINQTHFEKARKLQRLNWIVLRESEFLETSCVTVAGCLDLAYPACLSGFAPTRMKAE